MGFNIAPYFSGGNMYVVTGNDTHFLYMDNLIVIRNDTYENNMDVLDDVLFCLKRYKIQANIVKFDFSRNSISCLGLVETQEVINTHP